MRHSYVKPLSPERILEPDDQISLNGVNVRRHIQSRTCHDDSVDLIEEILGVVDGQGD